MKAPLSSSGTSVLSRGTSRKLKNAVSEIWLRVNLVVTRRFGGTYRLHYQGEKNQKARNIVSRS
jgi:hypothetical protein